jgi:putative ATP-dependent endonuclease of the OLD family
MVAQAENDATLQTIQLHFKYFLEDKGEGKMTLRWTTWGGATEGQAIKSEEAQLIYFSYLAPLRNAEVELRPYAKENKVISLF